MKIERIDLYQYKLQMKVPFAFSSGVVTHGEGLISVVYADGLVGWGECPSGTGPSYFYETVVTSWHIARDFLAPALLGVEFSEPSDLSPHMDFVRGHPFTKGMFDMAAWDLAAKRDGKSFAQELAAPYPEGAKSRVAAGIAVAIKPTVEETLELIGRRIEQGYQRIKLKIGPGHDLELARAARAAYPSFPLMLDANSAYQLEDAPIFKAMDDLDLMMIEQPLGYNDVYDHSLLRPQIKTPICLDESIHSLGDTRLALALKACDIINIKPGRVGGWTEARRIHDLCRANGIGLWIGGMFETGIGMAGRLALAALPGINLPGDLAESGTHYDTDFTQPFVLNAQDGTMTVPPGPGLGVEIDRQKFDAAVVRHERFARSPSISVSKS